MLLIKEINSAIDLIRYRIFLKTTHSYLYITLVELKHQGSIAEESIAQSSIKANERTC